MVTVRTAAAVGAALSSIGAQGGRLAFEQGRVVRDVRAGVNRSLNAETANLRRTVDAAVRQLDAVERLLRGRRRAGRRSRRPCAPPASCAAPTPTPHWGRSPSTRASAARRWPAACTASSRRRDGDAGAVARNAVVVSGTAAARDPEPPTEER